MGAKTVVILASISFYPKVIEIAPVLETKGYRVVMPYVARLMRDSGDFRVETYKTWLANPSEGYGAKNGLMLKHFDEVAAGDAVLVVNEEKHGLAGYIGGNVLMEMALAMHLKKPIFVLNRISDRLPVAEEVLGLLPTFLDGDLSRLTL